LSKNICSGNSLVSDDILVLFNEANTSESDIWRVNPFNFEVAFSDIMGSGGFDVVVGNPPYVFGEFHDLDTKPYIAQHFEMARYQYDTYWLFVERALYLLQGSGKLAYVLPDSLLARSEPAALRRLLLQSGLSRIYHCGQVFDGGVSAVVIVADVGAEVKHIDVASREGEFAVSEGSRSTERFLNDPEARLLIHASDEEAVILAKINDPSSPLESIAKVSRGEEAGKRNLRSRGTPILVGEDVSPHHIRPPTRYVDTVKKKMENYRGPKVLLVKTGATSIAAVDRSDSVTLQSVYNLRLIEEGVSEYALCAILNSNPMHWYIHKTFTAYKLLFPQLNQTTVLALPIPKADIDTYLQLNDLGQSLAYMTDELSRTRHEDARMRLGRRIAAAHSRIDTLVLSAWGLGAFEQLLVRH
jgi:hypothetical protein